MTRIQNPPQSEYELWFEITARGGIRRVTVIAETEKCVFLPCPGEPKGRRVNKESESVTYLRDEHDARKLAVARTDQYIASLEKSLLAAKSLRARAASDTPIE